MLFVVRNGDSSASVCVALRIHARRVSSSVKRARRAHTWLRDAAMTPGTVSAAHFWQRGHSSWRARFPRLRCFGSSAAALFSGHPPRLTIRSSRRRFLASLKLTIVRAILTPHCRGRRGLTQALGPQPCDPVTFLLFYSLLLALQCRNGKMSQGCIPISRRCIFCLAMSASSQ